ARVGVVGANGSGKTTLMRILAGLEPLDAGKVVQNKDQTVGYLPQDGLHAAGRTLVEECRSVFSTLVEVERELQENEARLEHTDDLSLFERYADLQHQFQVGGGPSLEAKIGTILTGLAFTPADMNRSCEEFSGGWQMRIALAKLLLMEPGVLLLDEPTNHLDLETRNWLEEYLSRYPNTCLLVSHDRYFLDAVVDRIVDLAQAKITVYTGNYTSFLRQKEDRLTQIRAAFKNQQERREQLETFINKFRYTATKAAQVQSRIKELERMEEIEIPPAEESIHFSFPQPRPSGRRVLELRRAAKAYGEVRVFKDLDLVLERGDRIGLIGQNGAGKNLAAHIGGRRSHGRRRAHRRPSGYGGLLRPGPVQSARPHTPHSRRPHRGQPGAHGAAVAYPAGQLPLPRRRCVQAHRGAERRRAQPLCPGAHAAAAFQLPVARRTHQPPRSEGQGGLARSPAAVQRNGDLRLPRPGLH